MIHELQIKDPARTPIPWWPEVKLLQGCRTLKFGPGLTILWGPNGCGKSTILRAMARMTHCEQGGVPLVTNESLLGLMESETTALDGLRIVGDGKPVHFLDPGVETGLISGAFDNDFMMEGVQSIINRKQSSGEQVLTKMNRIGWSAEKVTTVPTKHHQGYDKNFMTQATAALRSSCKTVGLPTLLFDEPDRSLSIPRQYEMWLALARVKRFQIIVATHSPFALTLGPQVAYIDLQEGYMAECWELIQKVAKR